MAMADLAVFGSFLAVAALVGWLAIRHLARHDQNPEVAKMWPEWWEGSPPDASGHPAIEEKLDGAISGILSWAARPPVHAHGLARSASSPAL
jgi:hypothetical protein